MARIDVYTADGQMVSTYDTDPDGNESTIREQAQQSLAANRTYLALTSPTAGQNAQQIKALTRQMNGVLRLLLNQFDGTD